MHDDRFAGLPFVVGEGANTQLDEFLALLDAAGDLRDRIRPASGRRPPLDAEDDNGVEVRLPEIDPPTALARLAALERESRMLDKDVISLDLRMPGRITARLTEDAAAARAAMPRRPRRRRDQR